MSSFSTFTKMYQEPLAHMQFDRSQDNDDDHDYDDIDLVDNLTDIEVISKL
jgi:hypothetical protein